MSSDADAAKPISVAIVGYGLGGRVFHAPLVKATPGLKVAAIVTRSQDKKLQANTDLPSAEVFGSFEELLAKANEFDLAVITTPNTEHAPQAIAAMKAGLHVVVDKPVAINSTQCKEMITVAKDSGRLLSVFQNRRWDSDFLTVKKLIESSALGSITRIESRFERWRPEPKPNSWRESSAAEDGGGLLFDLGTHAIDQATVLFGRPTEIYAEMNIRRGGIKSDDDSFVSLTFGNGVRYHIWVNLLAAAAGPRFRVLGSKGSYTKPGVDPQEEALRNGKTPMDPDWGKESESLWGTLSQYTNDLHIEGRVESERGCHQKFYEMMRDAINGNGPVPVDAEDALQTMQIIETARESAQRKQSLAMSQS